ncbi:MAG: ATP synthase F1 subunit gamma [Verrucomicrobia bacterium]|nr:MAG: ATP synthase F1 subunit gamma [Verrucomicrobiota bacterium]
MLAQILDSVSAKLEEKAIHPLLAEREVKRRGILLITTDRGLCGALNANLFRVVTELEGEAVFVSMGRKGTQFITRTGRKLLAEFPLSDKVGLHEIRPAAEMLVKAFLDGEVDTFEVIYPRFVNTLNQAPTRVQLLPISGIEDILKTLPDASEGAAFRRDPRDMTFEPDALAVLDRLLPLHISGQLYQIALSSKASEHSARMVAMKTAKDNATKLLDDLSLQYNKARQAAITQEILEIAAAQFAQS